MANRQFRPGDSVIYRATKHSTRPGPRAQSISASRHGEGYTYFVDKFWVVAEADEDRLLVRTRRGKTRIIDSDNPQLRHPNLWELLRFHSRFPKLSPSAFQS